MSSSTWLTRARALIAERIDLPETATLDEHRRALRALAPEFHGFTSWGRKVWAIAAREHLQRHGAPPVTIKQQAKFPPHIIFPFRRPQGDDQQGA